MKTMLPGSFPPSTAPNSAADVSAFPAVAPRPRPASKTRPKRRGRGRWYVAIVVIAALVGGGIWFMRHRAAAATSQAAVASKVIVVGRGDVEKSVTSSGKVVANLEVDIKCRASGEVIKLPFDISQTVKKGDLLCQLDTTDQDLAVQSAQAAVAQAEARLAQATTNVRTAELNLETTRRRTAATLESATVKAANLRSKANRQKELAAQDLASAEERETAETDAASAEADRKIAEISVEEIKQQEMQLEYKRQEVKTADAQLQAERIALRAQKQLQGYTTVTAPIDGTVSAMNVQKGTIIASGTSGFSGGTTIMTLSDLSRIFVLASVDQSDSGGLAVGQKVRIRVDSQEGRVFAGEVVRVATKGTSASSVVTFDVKIEVLDEHKEMLKPETTGNVEIIQQSRTNVITVPTGAVVRRGAKTSVTLEGDRQQDVVLGLQSADDVEIISGLREGDRVLVNEAELPSKWKNEQRGPGGPPPP